MQLGGTVHTTCRRTVAAGLGNPQHDRDHSGRPAASRPQSLQASVRVRMPSGMDLPKVQNAARKFQALQHGPQYSVLPSKVTSPDRGLNHRLGKMASRISSFASESSLEAAMYLATRKKPCSGQRSHAAGNSTHDASNTGDDVLHCPANLECSFCLSLSVCVLVANHINPLSSELLEAMPVCRSTAKKPDRCMPMEPTSSAQNAKNDNNTKTNTLQNNDLNNDMCCFMLSCNGCVLGGTTCASKADGLSMPPPFTLRSHASHERLGRHAVADVACSLKPSHPPQGCVLRDRSRSWWRYLMYYHVVVVASGVLPIPCLNTVLAGAWVGLLQFAGAWTPVVVGRAGDAVMSSLVRQPTACFAELAPTRLLTARNAWTRTGLQTHGFCDCKCRLAFGCVRLCVGFP